MDASKLSKISSDAHVNEPHDLWFERLPVNLRDRAPRRIELDDDGGWTLVVNGQTEGWKGMTADASKVKDEERVREATIDPRLEMMRIDGVNAEIIFPTIGMYAWNITDGDVGRETCRIYNDWIRERLGGNPRVKVAGAIPTWSVEMAIDEIERISDDPSIGALLLPLAGTPDWNLPVWEPLWAAIVGTGKTVAMHQGTGHEMVFYRGWGSPTVNVIATQTMAPRTAALFSCSGILERYPDLHVALVEVNAGWVAWLLHTLDEYYEAHRSWVKPKLAEPPSHYVRRQIHATFQDDAVAIHNIPLTGTDCLLWGNDFPHGEGIYPHSNKVLSEILDGVSATDAEAITSRNALRLFGFDSAVLQSAP